MDPWMGLEVDGPWMDRGWTRIGGMDGMDGMDGLDGRDGRDGP